MRPYNQQRSFTRPTAAEIGEGGKCIMAEAMSKEEQESSDSEEELDQALGERDETMEKEAHDKWSAYLLFFVKKCKSTEDVVEKACQDPVAIVKILAAFREEPTPFHRDIPRQQDTSCRRFEYHEIGRQAGRQAQYSNVIIEIEPASVDEMTMVAEVLHMLGYEY